MNKNKAAQQLEVIRLREATTKELTKMVIVALKLWVNAPQWTHTSAVKLLKTYLSFDQTGRGTIANSRHLRKQTVVACYQAKVDYEAAVEKGFIVNEVKSSAHVATKVDNNGWGKSFDLSNVTVREATHADFVSTAAKKGKNEKKNPDGKKNRK